MNKLVSKTNRKRSEFLGMPFGTATNRLRKQVLFRLLEKYGENTCCICNLKIEKVEQLSIEHKISWLNSDNPVFNFWDLDNIGFAHLKCNRPTTVGINKSLRNSPKDDSNSICSDCKLEKPRTLFNKRKDRWNGLDHRCKECAKLSVYKYRTLKN